LHYYAGSCLVVVRVYGIDVFVMYLVIYYASVVIRFRHNWLVERSGKWAEPDYPAMVYPKFACGAGYVLSSDLVHWLDTNADTLAAYQVSFLLAYSVTLLIFDGRLQFIPYDCWSWRIDVK